MTKDTISKVWEEFEYGIDECRSVSRGHHIEHESYHIIKCVYFKKTLISFQPPPYKKLLSFKIG